MFFKSVYGRYAVKSRKILAITSDNATNNDDNFFDALRNKYEVVEGKMPSNLQFAHARIRCFAHILNLSVQSMLQSLNMAPGSRPKVPANPPSLDTSNPSQPTAPSGSGPSGTSGNPTNPSTPPAATASGSSLSSGDQVGASGSGGGNGGATSESGVGGGNGGGTGGDDKGVMGGNGDGDSYDSDGDDESEWSDDDNFVVEIPQMTAADEGEIDETHQNITGLVEGTILDDVKKTEDVGNIVNKLRAFIKKIKSSPKLAEELIKIQQQAPFKDNPLFRTPLKVILDVKTRWNSTQAMIERAWIMKPVFDQYHDEFKQPHPLTA
ncbi:hypothetical protein HDU76_010882, partial [Blyttiomyces sp. JEL0837]